MKETERKRCLKPWTQTRTKAVVLRSGIKGSGFIKRLDRRETIGRGSMKVTERK